MPHHRAILAAATFLCLFPLAGENAFGQTQRTLTEAPAQPTSGPVSVTFDRADAKYAVGEIVGLFIDAKADSYVTVINVSPSGNVVKLFPNKYQKDGFIGAGKRVQVPDPASGARLEVSGPVGQEQIRVFYSPKPLAIFADLGSDGGGMFRSIDGGIDEVSRSLDQARSLGAKISSKTMLLTTVESRPASETQSAAIATPDKNSTGSTSPDTSSTSTEPVIVKPPKDAPPKKASVAVIEKPKAEVKLAKPVTKPRHEIASPDAAPVKQKPKTYKIVTHLAPGQVLAEDELELVGKVPNNTISAATLKPLGTQQARPVAQSAQMPQFQMPQFQMPQVQMPQVQMPQVQMPQVQMPQMPQVQMPQLQMPQIQLPGGLQLQLPQLQIPMGRSAEKDPQAGQQIAASAPASAIPAACAAMLDKMNQSVAAKDIKAAAADVDGIAVSAECGQFQVVAQRRLAALRLSAAQDMMAANRPASDYEPILAAADGPQVLWQASATLGEVHFSERRFADAAAEFQQAIEIIKNETRTPKAPAADTIGDLIQRAAQARILAANPTTAAPSGQFVPVEKDHRSGMLGGIYSPDVRGIVPVSIPVPITFDFNQTSFTPVGTQAAEELAEALKEQKPGRVILIGHTDRKGADDYNQKLSVRRAQAVADFLKSKGIDASIEADGRGASDPVDVAATGNLTEDDIDALNRRVEWHRE